MNKKLVNGVAFFTAILAGACSFTGSGKVSRNNLDVIGTETGNPSIHSVDMKLAKAYVSNDNGKDPLFGNAPLLKILRDGNMAPAITLTNLPKNELPTVVRMSALKEGTYVQFGSLIEAHSETCFLVEIKDEQYRCVDSESKPALNRGDNPLLPLKEGSLRFMVARVQGSEQDVYFQTPPTQTNDTDLSAIAVRSGTSVTAFGPSHFAFKQIFQSSSGNMFANGCYDLDQPTGAQTPVYMFCKIEKDTVTTLSPELDAQNVNGTAEALSTNRLIVSLPMDPMTSASYPMNLRIGSLGDELNITNFTTDIKDPIQDDLFGFHTFFETDNGIWGINTEDSGKACFADVKNRFFEFCADQEWAITSIDYKVGGNIAVYFKRPYLLNQTDCVGALIDPATGTSVPLRCVDAEVSVTRYLDDEHLIVGGKAKNEEGYRYFQINLADQSVTSFFSSSRPAYFYVP